MKTLHSQHTHKLYGPRPTHLGCITEQEKIILKEQCRQLQEQHNYYEKNNKSTKGEASNKEPQPEGAGSQTP